MNKVAVDAVKGWTEWLDTFTWDQYHTLTFKEDTHPEQAEKEFRRYMRKINETIYGKRYRRRGDGVSWTCAMERQRRGVVHFHCLTNGTAKLKFRDLYELWRRVSKNTGFAKIESYEPGKGATGYLSKYVSKGGEVDIYINEKRQQRSSQVALDIG